MQPNTTQLISTTLFLLAVIHTFLTPYFHSLGNKFKEGSLRENFFHLMGEVEVVFGIWAFLFMLFYAKVNSLTESVQLIENIDLKEPIFVFVIMAIASTKPITYAVRESILWFTSVLPGKPSMKMILTISILGPLTGSLITEPAAMTICASLLSAFYFNQKISDRVRYAITATLFVNISVGGVLTNFAAPPVIMIASKWGWTTHFMFSQFGIKAICIVILNSVLMYFLNKHEIDQIETQSVSETIKIPIWIIFIHFLFLVFAVLLAHYPKSLIASFLFFLGVYQVTKEYQNSMNLRSPLLVAFFLGGLIVLGGYQGWWLTATIALLSSFKVFVGATLLTAVTDNAALTFLGSQVPNIEPVTQYYLVAGAVTGGGLTLIANAPNPAGNSILAPSFSEGRIHPWQLLKSAIIPTLIAFSIFGIL